MKRMRAMHNVIVSAVLLSPSELVQSSGKLRGKVESLIEEIGLPINYQEMETCYSRSLETDCHDPTDGHRCVYCPTYSLPGVFVDTAGVCLPARVFGFACPKTSRALL